MLTVFQSQAQLFFEITILNNPGVMEVLCSPMQVVHFLCHPVGCSLDDLSI